MKRPGNLVLKIYVYGVCIVAVAAGCFFGFIGLLRSQRESDVSRMTGRVIGDLVAHRSTPSDVTEDVARLRRQLPVDITVYTPEGALIGSTVTPPLAMLAPEDIAKIGTRDVVRLGPERYVHVVREKGKTVALGLVGLRGALSSPPNWIWPLGMILLLLIGVALAFARHLARPLQIIANTAQRFGRGDLAARTGLDRNDEIGRAGRAVDEMAERVTTLMTSQRELMANVSHELRTPLARIRVAVDLIVDGEQATAQELLPEIATDLGELERLLDDVMTVSRLDLSREMGTQTTTPLRLEEVQVGDLVDRAAARFRGQHPDHPLVVDVGNGLPLLAADAVLLRRVFDNLLDNARKYSDAGTEIHLAARRDGDEVQVTVADRGIGIDAEDISKLFQPFFRTDKSRSRATGGSGLGLVLARRVVEAHGGRIAVMSTPGCGTTFTIALPTI